jgi:hypothetical protein
VRALALVSLLVACGDDATAFDAGRPDAGRPDAGTDAGSDSGVDASAISCDDILAQTTAFIDANKACSVDADCFGAEVRCAMTLEEACCYTYLNGAVDVDRFLALTSRLRECAGMMCECCASPRPRPACIDNRCGPGAM